MLPADYGLTPECQHTTPNGQAYIKRLGRMYEKRQRELKTEGGGGGAAASSGKKTDKRLEKLEKDLRMGQKDMTMMTMKTSLLLGVVSSAVYFTVSGRYVAGSRRGKGGGAICPAG